jgi:hypothetical protein
MDVHTLDTALQADIYGAVVDEALKAGITVCEHARYRGYFGDVHLQGDSVNRDAVCHESGDQVIESTPHCRPTSTGPLSTRL